MAEHSHIAILDAGSQYGKLIDKHIRGLGVNTKLYPLETKSTKLHGVQGIVISGGPESVYEPESPRCDPGIFDLGVPVLGICYGMQLQAAVLDGKVEHLPVRQDGQTQIRIDPDRKIFHGLEREQTVLLTHGDIVTETPPGFSVIARNDHEGIVGMQSQYGQIIGLQFHPEVMLTLKGRDMLARFVWDICGCDPNYYPADRITELKETLRQEIGDRHVIALLSGGVDSTVAARLVSEVIPPDRVHAIHVDHGFMRKNESELVLDSLGILGMDIHHIDGSDQFLAGTTIKDGQNIGPLGEVINPEHKRAIIGDVFMQLVDNEVSRIGVPLEDMVLLQGTLRPDLIESASTCVSGKAHVIKTHHNDTHLVRKLRDEGRVVEPLKDFHKDEVRELGRLLDLPEKLVNRQPFPGPGLAIRILCSDGGIDDDWYQIRDQGSLYEAEILPIKSVGVQGDGRGYKWVSAIHDVPWSEAYTRAQMIVRHVHSVGRVVKVLGREAGEMSLTETYLGAQTANLLREADWVIRDVFEEYQCYKNFAQTPVILLPLSFGKKNGHSIVIRPFITTDFMTGTPGIVGKDIPERAIQELTNRLLNLPSITAVFYDVTGKPPGTTEWE